MPPIGDDKGFDRTLGLRLGQLLQQGREMTPSTFGNIVERAVEDATDPRVRQSQLSALEERVGDIAGVVREVAEGVLRAEVREEQRKADMQRMRDDICDGERRVEKAIEGLAATMREDRTSTALRLAAVEEQSSNSAEEIATAKTKVKTAVGVATFIGAGLFWLAEHLFELWMAMKGQK